MNLMLFCSNPYNGGTARIFYESADGFNNALQPNDRLFCCTNAGNEVEIYKKVANIVRLPIESAEEKYPELYGGRLFVRVLHVIKRNLLYKKKKRENIEIICKYLADNNVDAVIIHNGGYVGDDLCNQVLEASYKCAEFCKKRIYVLHNDMDKGLISKLRFRGYDNKISREATSIVTVSQYTKKRMERLSYIKKEIKVIYNGIDALKKSGNDDSKTRITVNPNYHNILMIGNIMEYKGQIEFIESAALLSKKHKSYRFVIIGNIYDEDYYEKCCHLIKKYMLEDIITIYNGVNNASDYIDMFDVQVVPSLFDESFGLISVEAMANGVPVVAFECGGIPEVVINNRNGFLVPVGDTNEMAERIEWIITHKEHLEKMKENCRNDYKNKFSTASMVKNYMDLLD